MTKIFKIFKKFVEGKAVKLRREKAEADRIAKLFPMPKEILRYAE